MYENLPLDALVPNPENANHVSRMFPKKLLHNIEQTGKYETLTVRPHPNMKDKFEILNGHALARTAELHLARFGAGEATLPEASAYTTC